MTAKYYRNAFTIAHEILTFCSEPRTKTKIMYGTLLSFTQLKMYLGELIAKDLLSMQNGVYVSTNKGRAYVANLDEVKAMCNGWLLETREHAKTGVKPQ